MNTTKQDSRVLVIGLDGATFEIITPMVRKGKLPNFAQLMKKGSFGPLKSSIPPTTPSAWTSFATGKSPSKHGLYDFCFFYKGDPEKLRWANRTFVKAKSLWRILTEAGRKSIVIDVPFTYPPEDINGCMISRILATSWKDCTSPKSLYHTLRRKGFIKEVKARIAKGHGADSADKEKIKEGGGISKSRQKKLDKERIEAGLRGMKEELDENVELAAWLMKKQDWDFFMMVFMSADCAGHAFWGDQPKVKEIYEKLDEAIGRLFKLAGKDTIKFIISDHGFTTIPYFFNVNEWLYSKGLLSKKFDISGIENMRRFKEFLRKEKKKNPKRTSTGKEDKPKRFQYSMGVDFPRSKAYLQSDFICGVRINLEGRDRAGIVKRLDYQPLRDYLINEFKKIKHPLTGKKLFAHVLKKEEAYHKSPFDIDPAPDIFLITPDMKIKVHGQLKRVPSVFGRTSRGFGSHHMDGIFFAQGREIENLWLSPARITDLMPTILHIFGVPLPDDLDGRVLSEIFKQASRYSRQEICYQGPSVLEEEKRPYSKAEQEKIRDKLQALGYIE